MSHKSPSSSSAAPRLFHHFTVCMVPPEDAGPVWQKLSEIRSECRDPGFYRWPPHANLLYPFVDPYHNNGINDSILEKLRLACRAVEPFVVKLHEFGTFGGKNNGILWLKPNDGGRLGELQASLVRQFPCCAEERSFTPHITVGHYRTRTAAQDAQTLQELQPPSLEFPVREIYLLGRFGGENGQFARVATIGLGNSSTVACHVTEETTKGEPLPFRRMPDTEPDWVREERTKLQQRRRQNQGGRRGGRGDGGRGGGGGGGRGRGRGRGGGRGGRGRERGRGRGRQDRRRRGGGM